MACIVRGCRSRPQNKNNSGENISFHGFPKNEVLQSKWFAATCRSKEQYKKFWKVCSRHFAPTNFVGVNLLRAYLKENSVPTLHLPHKSDMMGMSSSNTQHIKLDHEESDSGSDSGDVSLCDSVNPTHEDDVKITLKTDASTALDDEFMKDPRAQKMQEKIRALTKQNRTLRHNTASLQRQIRNLRDQNRQLEGKVLVLKTEDCTLRKTLNRRKLLIVQKTKQIRQLEKIIVDLKQLLSNETE